MTLQAIFSAGRVRRWHKNPALSWTDDYLDGHQGRVARILLALHPKPSAALLAAALTHDDGEAGPGDMAGDDKRANPVLAGLIGDLEHAKYVELWGGPPIADALPETDQAWLKFADSLDAYMWMMHKAPGESSGNGWPEQRGRLVDFAHLHEILKLMQGVL